MFKKALVSRHPWVESLPRWVVVACCLGAILAGAGCSREAKLSRYLSRAEAYFASAEYEKAFIEYQNVLRLEPTNGPVLLRIARIFFEQGMPLRAMQLLQTADLKPDDPLLRCRVAEFQLATGDRGRGRNELVALLAQSPTNSEALRLLAGSAATPEEVTNTMVYLRQFESRFPDSPPLLLANALLLIGVNQVESAERLVQRALQLDPKSVQGHVQMAQIHMRHTNLAAADESLATAVRLAPHRSAVRLAYARAKANAGKVAEARRVLKETVREAPDYLPALLVLAGVETQEKNYDEALALTGRIVSRDPLNFEAREMRTQLHAAKQQPEKAALEWEQLDQNLRPNPLVKLQMARAHLLNRDATKAAAALDAAIALSSNRLDRVAIDAHLLRARLDIDGRNPANAVELLQRLLGRTNIVAARVLLADAQRRAGRLDDAAATCQGLVRDAPQNPTYAFVLGTVLRERGRVAEARSALRRSLELAPGNPLTLYQLVDLELGATNAPAALQLVRAELGRTNTAALRFLEGRVLAAQRRWSEATSALEASLELDSDFSSAYQLLAGIHIAQTNFAGAARELEELVAQRTNDVRSLMILASLYDQLGQTKQAGAKYSQILAVQPQFVPALNNLAYLHTERLPDLERAHELAQKARQLAPNDPSVADTLGWILHKRGEDIQALPLLREAAERRTDSAEIQYHLGTVHYLMGQPEAARLALQRAVAGPGSYPGKAEAQQQLDRIARATAGGATDRRDRSALEKLVKDQPNDLTARSELAGSYEQEGKFPQAAAEYEEVLRRNRRSALAALRLAQLNAGPLNDAKRAIEYARKARELAPADPEAAAVLGRLLLRSGEHTQAYSLLQSAAPQLPRRADVQFDLAWAAYAIGRLSEASQAMSRALTADPAFREAAAARAFLAMTAAAQNPETLGQAEPQIQAVLKSDPNHAPALMAQAALFRARGNSGAAAPLYAAILSRFPACTPASRELGLLLTSDPAQAAKAYDLLVRVREARPDDAEVARALAVLSYRRQDYQYTVTLLESCLRGQTADAETLFYLGMAQCRSKQVANGQQRLQQAIAAGLKEPMLADAKRVLASAKPPAP